MGWWHNTANNFRGWVSYTSAFRSHLPLPLQSSLGRGWAGYCCCTFQKHCVIFAVFLRSDYSRNITGQDKELWIIDVVKPHFKELCIWYSYTVFIEVICRNCKKLMIPVGEWCIVELCLEVSILKSDHQVTNGLRNYLCLFSLFIWSQLKGNSFV